MCRQANIIAIISSNITKIVREMLAARKVLAEIGNASGQWVPARIDDSSVRQDRPYETDIDPVVRKLVDEEWAVGLALRCYATEIFLADRPQFLTGQLGKPAMGTARRSAIAEPVPQFRNIRQFGNGLDLTVARQDLLDQ